MKAKPQFPWRRIAVVGLMNWGLVAAIFYLIQADQIGWVAAVGVIGFSISILVTWIMFKGLKQKA